MVTYTDEYGLAILEDGDLSPDGYKFVNADRVLMDLLLWLGAEGHHHTGAPSDVNAPTLSPTLTLDVTTGSLPASTRVYYQHTYVDPNGVETTASDIVWIDTPAAVSAPAAATLTTADTGGTLPPGTFMYRLAAYKDFNDLETLAGAPASIQLPHNAATLTNVITLTLPALPSGADGYNVYRRGPGEVGYRYLTSIAGAPVDWDDDGSIIPTQDRPPATANTTESTNSVEVELAEALPAGYLWRLYRTTVAGEWDVSLLATVGPAVTTYTDTGAATSVGQPPTVGSAPGSPAKINLATEVQGELPATSVENLMAFLALKQDLDERGAAGGYATLDDDARIPSENLPGIALVAAARAYR